MPNRVRNVTLCCAVESLLSDTWSTVVKQLVSHYCHPCSLFTSPVQLEERVIHTLLLIQTLFGHTAAMMQAAILLLVAAHLTVHCAAAAAVHDNSNNNSNKEAPPLQTYFLDVRSPIVTLSPEEPREGVSRLTVQLLEGSVNSHMPVITASVDPGVMHDVVHTWTWLQVGAGRGEVFQQVPVSRAAAVEFKPSRSYGGLGQ